MKRNLQSLLIFILILATSCLVQAQSQGEKFIDLSFENRTLPQVLYDISNTHDVQFYFVPDEMPYYPLNGNFKQETVFAVVNKLTEGTNLIVFPYKDAILVVDREKANRAELDDILFKWDDGTYDYPFEKNTNVLNYTFGTADNVSSKDIPLTINITDEKSKDPIIGVIARNEDLSINGLSDANGQVALSLPSGPYALTLSYIGYQTTQLNIELYEAGTIDLTMAFQSFLFDEVEIVASGSEQKIQDAELGKEVIDIERIEAIPQVLGEVDIIKSLETLPGVTSAGELSIGFNVRGGNIDESLVLFNDGIIFNPTHIVGFISAFNADALDNATLYKAYVDPAYGGRGSAILDLQSDATNVKNWKGKGGLGTSMMKLYLEGPVSDKVQFHLRQTNH